MKVGSLVLVSLLITSVAFADTGAIYAESQGGRVVFTDKPKSATAKKAELPKLGKWSTKELAVRPTCTQHGGIDCSRGADGDGSVFCRDGFDGAEHPYAFNCTVAELEVTGIQQKGSGFVVSVRNSSGVAAKGASITFRPNPQARLAMLDGPALIEPFEVVDFTFVADGAVSGGVAAPKLAELQISCTNCNG